MFSTMKTSTWFILLQIILWLLVSEQCYSSIYDVQCLKTLLQSIKDPDNNLTPSWNFQNTTEGAICRFNGIECWHIDENKVLNIRLSNMNLQGHFPLGLENCTSMTGLDLSNNNFDGPIPEDIAKMIPYVTTLDLSYNSFKGDIPFNLSNCTYLNVLNLQHNQLTGMIPWSFSNLVRLTTFNAADNMLSGPLPVFKNSISADNFANNNGLCGKPLSPCPAPSKKANAGVIIGSATGGILGTVLVVGVILYFCMRNISTKKKEKKVEEENKWAKNLKSVKGIKVSTFEKSMKKMNLNELLIATKDFSKENIIATGSTGSIYRASFTDGTFLAVKRLQEAQHTESHFAAEMETLGRIRHQNLVPLLGFCVAKKERLLIYKYMQKGSLHDSLHPQETDERVLEWPLRLKISIGAAKGLAWLHHSCNPRILHRNISSKCILLDDGYEPRISDFGLARLMNPIDTHLSTFVNGEFGDLGYVAPEYARTLVATPKGDIYSFGVVLLEILTREMPTQVNNAPENFKGSLVEWITYLQNSSILQNAIDRDLIGKGYDNELLQVMKVACSCVQANAKERPTMFEVYQLLRAIGERYHFTVDDEVLMMPGSGDTDYLDELIVAK